MHFSLQASIICIKKNRPSFKIVKLMMALEERNVLYYIWTVQFILSNFQILFTNNLDYQWTLDLLLFAETLQHFTRISRKIVVDYYCSPYSTPTQYYKKISATSIKLFYCSNWYVDDLIYVHSKQVGNNSAKSGKR